MGTVIIHPETGFEKVIAKELLALADNPMHVEYVMWPSPGFRVPEDLFDRWTHLTEEPVPADQTVTVAVPPKRKPGRPKKEAQ